MRGRFNFIISVVMLFSFGFMVDNLRNICFTIPSIQREFWLVLVFMICFFFIHISKASRLYLILLEDRLPFHFFLFLYGLTTFITLALPYKVGEVFRMYCFGSRLKHMGKGILSILVDRYFDTMGLLLLLLPLEFYYGQGLSGFSLFLLFFLSLLILSYYAFPSIYVYLNAYLIFRVHSKRGILALRVLENMNRLYCNIQFLMKERTPLLMLLSFFAWIFEMGALMALFYVNGSDDFIWQFISYLGALIGNPALNDFFQGYLLLDGCLVFFFLIGMTIIYFRKARTEQ